jgi:hypothetical protein
MRTTRLIGICPALVLALAVLVSAGCGGSGGGGSSKEGVPGGHSVGKTVSFTDRYGRETVSIESAGTTDRIFKDLAGQPYEPREGVFVFVTLNKFQSAVLDAGELLELRGSDGRLYASRLSNGPDSGGAMSGFVETDPNHFTEAFDVPKEAAKGAVLIVHENGTDRSDWGSSPRPVPEGYDEGAHEVDLGL